MNDMSSKNGKPEKPKAPRGKPGDCEVIERPNLLKKKIGEGKGFDLKAMARAEQVIEEARVGYVERALEQLAECDELFKTMRSLRHYDFREMWDIAHAIRGEAGTMNYPLLTRLGNSLCGLLSAIEDQPGQKELQAIATHLAAMRTVVNNRLEGDGPEAAAEVTAALNDLVKRYEKGGW